MAAHLVRAGDAAEIAPLLRIPEVDAGFVKKVLNLGIQGIVPSARHEKERRSAAARGPLRAGRHSRLVSCDSPSELRPAELEGISG